MRHCTIREAKVLWESLCLHVLLGKKFALDLQGFFLDFLHDAPTFFDKLVLNREAELPYHTRPSSSASCQTCTAWTNPVRIKSTAFEQSQHLMATLLEVLPLLNEVLIRLRQPPQALVNGLLGRHRRWEGSNIYLPVRI